jgi:hypothetical protein
MNESAQALPQTITAFVLNDVVMGASWQDDDGEEIHYSVRFTGVSADDTLHFRVRRHSSYRSGGGSFIPPVRMPRTPETWEVRIPLRAFGNSVLARTFWRIGPSGTDLRQACYTVSEDRSILIEIECPPDAQKDSKIKGFRRAVEESSRD